MAETASIAALDLHRYSEQIDSALAQATPCTVATSDLDGNVDIGLKGSMMVFDAEHLAYLERAHGTHLENLRQNPSVAVCYYNRAAGTAMVRFFGEAQVLESGDVRDEIRRRTVPPELAKDPDNRGLGVLIRVDRVMEFGRKVFER